MKVLLWWDVLEEDSIWALHSKEGLTCDHCEHQLNHDRNGDSDSGEMCSEHLHTTEQSQLVCVYLPRQAGNKLQLNWGPLVQWTICFWSDLNAGFFTALSNWTVCLKQMTQWNIWIFWTTFKALVRDSFPLKETKLCFSGSLITCMSTVLIIAVRLLM